MNKVLFLVVAFFAFQFVSAQDVIDRTNPEAEKNKVEESNANQPLR